VIRVQQKPLSWLGDSLDVVKDFAQEAKKKPVTNSGVYSTAMSPQTGNPWKQ
jgi:hypothetical protein